MRAEEHVTHPMTILLQLCASLTLDEHMGDVADDVHRALELAGLIQGDDVLEWPDDYADMLYRRGVTTLWGTSMEPDDE